MRRFLVLGAALLGSTLTVLAQAGQCPVLVQDALNAAQDSCSATERNQACYGNVQIEATLTNPALTFAKQGDTIPLSAIDHLKLAGLDMTDGTWGVALLRVQADIPDTMPGQNVTFLLFGENEIDNLSGTDAPMRAVYFKSGMGSTECLDAPDGLLVQTPEGVDEIHFNINGAEVSLGSTAFFQTRLNDEGKPPSLTMSVLEGQGSVTAYGVTQPVFAGSWVRIPIDADFNVAAAPKEPKPYQFDTFDVLPIGLLDRKFTIVPSLTQAQIDAKLSDLILMTPIPPTPHTLTNETAASVQVMLPGSEPMTLEAGKSLSVDLYDGLHRVVICQTTDTCGTLVIETPGKSVETAISEGLFKAK